MSIIDYILTGLAFVIVGGIILSVIAGIALGIWMQENERKEHEHEQEASAQECVDADAAAQRKRRRAAQGDPA